MHFTIIKSNRINKERERDRFFCVLNKKFNRILIDATDSPNTHPYC